VGGKKCGYIFKVYQMKLICKVHSKKVNMREKCSNNDEMTILNNLLISYWIEKINFIFKYGLYMYGSMDFFNK
jgi:hypothetical protein